MSDQVRDMTEGTPAKLILLFAVPLMLGNIFQQLYTMVDTIVVGQIAGVQALAALGAVEWIMWMVLGVSTGITQGFSILISQHYGAKKWNDLKKSSRSQLSAYSNHCCFASDRESARCQMDSGTFEHTG